METTTYYNNDSIRVILGFKDLHAFFGQFSGLWVWGLKLFMNVRRLVRTESYSSACLDPVQAYKICGGFPKIRGPHLKYRNNFGVHIGNILFWALPCVLCRSSGMDEDHRVLHSSRYSPP